MTGIEITNSGDGIFEDGEWVSWEYLTQQMAMAEERAPKPMSELLKKLIDIAREYRDVTKRDLPIYGEIGELYAQEQFAITRHKPNAQGSDGKIGSDFVEIKTITPGKKKKRIHLKRSGNFSKIAVVKINDDLTCEARLVDRASLKKGTGRKATLSWSSLKCKERAEPGATDNPDDAQRLREDH